jgi:methionyl-tRNA formyltransferase|tara:strand:- start:2552 stop:3229 length:678 start_codon:yes stop_codon:yes gene_type:complete
MKNIVVATIHQWNIDNFNKWTPPRGYTKHLICDKKELTRTSLEALRPSYIFFPHWSWIIPPDVYENFKCIIFHMTDLPFGRGGSPMQNLIIRGIYKTKVSAIRAQDKIDTGDVYLKYPFDISSGSAQELFERLSDISFDMMSEIVKKNPLPRSQKGKTVVFKRRTPKESRIPQSLNDRKLYDFVRMLDAEGYPKAFIKNGNHIFEFYNARFEDDVIRADVLIKNK